MWCTFGLTSVGLVVFFYLLPKYWEGDRTYVEPAPVRVPADVGTSQIHTKQPPAWQRWEVRDNLTREWMGVELTARGRKLQGKLVPENNHRIDRRPPKKARSSQQLCEFGLDEEELKNAAALGFHPLSQFMINHVEKFLFFIGYPRSGHSMIGSVLDAHPNVVIANEYKIFPKCVSELHKDPNTTILNNKTTLFNDLYRNSFLSSKCGWRSAMKTSKGYNFAIPAQWQGKFSHLRVIGDKSGGYTSSALQYESGVECLRRISSEIGVPVVAVHVVRNPFDMIATAVLYELANVTHTKASDILQRKLYPDLCVVLDVINMCFESARIVEEFSKHFSVIEIHIEDYIRDPKSSIRQMCKVLGLPCPQDYIQECHDKAYKSVSRSRDLIEWTDSPVSLISMVRKSIAQFPFFHGYTFENDFRLIDV